MLDRLGIQIKRSIYGGDGYTEVVDLWRWSVRELLLSIKKKKKLIKGPRDPDSIDACFLGVLHNCAAQLCKLLMNVGPVASVCQAL